MRAARAWVAPFYVNEYEADRAYGGSQEGGWWYDVGTFVECHGTYATRAEAELRKIELLPRIAEKRAGLHPPESVLSEGMWPELHVEDAGGRLPGAEGRCTSEETST